MSLGPHAIFIATSYILAGLVIVVLTAWVAIDYRAQRRALAELERSGVRRRSVPERASPEREPAA